MTAKHKRKAIICDIDGTLADCTHRRHFLEQEHADWNSFYREMGEDTVNEWCAKLIHAMSRYGHEVILCSGRPEDYRRVTETWLTFAGVVYDQLFMRKAGDSRQDAVVKEEILKEQILPNYEVLFVVDDRQQVVDTWRRNGLVCLQCDKGDF